MSTSYELYSVSDSTKKLRKANTKIILITFVLYISVVWYFFSFILVESETWKKSDTYELYFRIEFDKINNIDISQSSFG